MRRRGQILLKMLAASAAVLMCAAVAFGLDSAQYKQRLLKARAIVLDVIYESANGTAADTNAGFDADKIVAIRKLLPASENLETNYGTQPVSNAWVHSRLDQFITETDYNKRLVVLSEIEERLAALIWKLDEAEKAEAGGTTKDEEKQKLAEILTREQFQKTSEEGESLFQRWFNKFLEWLDSLFPESQPVERRATGMPGAALAVQIIVAVVLILLVGFGIYKLRSRLLPRRRQKKERPDDRVILGERIGADMDAQDVFSEAERLAREGDVRGAIRKGYIALLCELSDRKMIGLARHKTNRDYLRDVRKRGEIYDAVRGMTSSFEHHWYGSKPSGPDDWEQFRTAYREASARI